MARYSETDNLTDRRSRKGVPDLRHGKKPAHSERMKQVYAGKRARNQGLGSIRKGDAALLLDVFRDSVLRFADADLDYVTIQMSKATWEKLQARYPETSRNGNDG